MIITVTPNPAVDKTFALPILRPGDKNHAGKVSCIAGGKGVNVARAVRALGGESLALVAVAGATGRHVVEMIEADEVRCVPVWTDGITRTITTILEEDAHRQTPLFEPGPALTEPALYKLREELLRLLPHCSVVTFNGAVPAAENADMYQELIPLVRKHKAIPVLDAHGAGFTQGLAAKPYLVKPNLQELEEYVGATLPSDSDRWDAMHVLHDGGVDMVALSLGAEGCMLSMIDGTRLRAIPPRIQEVNAVGSGDCFLAAFVLSLERGWDLEETLRTAVAAGTANAATWEIGHVSLEMLERYKALVEVSSLR